MTRLGILLILGSPILTVLTHALLARLIRKKQNQLVALFSITLGNFLSLLAIAMVEFPSPHWISSLLFASVCVLGLGHVYFHFFNMSETARRIRLLTTLYAGQKQSLVSYRPEELISIRLQRLIDLGQVEKHGSLLIARWGPLRMASILIKTYEGLIYPEREIKIRP